MKKHLFFIDPLNKLNPKKDTSLMLASTMKEQGIEVYLLFEEDFYLSNKKKVEFKVFDFEFEFYEDHCYLKKFNQTNSKSIELVKDDVIHMRIDPPFDTRYLRYLWMLRYYQEQGIKILNSPDGILKFNEKLHAYAQRSSLPTYVGSSAREFEVFVSEAKKRGDTHLILKPLDLYQGIGVEKRSLGEENLINLFENKVKSCNGPVVAQPYCSDVEKGEIRSIFYRSKELGSILKVPKSGEFLANIAQGASFSAVELTSALQMECTDICRELLKDGVDLVAFDILGGHVSEINITCPGLLVEVSFAHQKNLALEIIKQF